MGISLEGKRFKTFKEWETYLDEIKAQGHRLSKIRCETIASGNKKRKKQFPEELGYSFLVYECPHSGHHASKSTVRTGHSIKNRCPVRIYLAATRKQNDFFLEVKTCRMRHDHSIPKPNIGVLPIDRRLTGSLKKEVVKLLENQTPVSSIRKQIHKDFDILVTQKDLHNLKDREGLTNPTTKDLEGDVFQVLEDMITNDKDGIYSVFSEDDKINFLFFQTGIMKKKLKNYSEILFIDSTYCINNFKYPVVVFMVADENNHGHVVGYAIVRNEKLMTFDNLYGEFFKRNDKITVLTVVIDKDASEIGAVKKLNKSINIILCRFHVMKAFHSKLEKCNISKDSFSEYWRHIHKMVHCVEEMEFFDSLGVLPADFFVYVMSNWYDYRTSWATCYTKNVVTWGNLTNNIVERHNRTLKTLFTSKTTLKDFFIKLLEHHRTDGKVLYKELYLAENKKKQIHFLFQRWSDHLRKGRSKVKQQSL